MRLFPIPLLLALPLSLAACGSPAAPEGAGAASPPVATPAPPSDRTEARSPDEPTAALQPEAPLEPVETAHEDGARQRIAALLGDAPQYERVFNAFKAAVVSGDRAAVVEHVRFPLRVANGAQIADAGEFQRRYESIITPAVVTTLKAQDFDSLFVNAQGVMAGDGQVWLNGQCLDAACERTDVKVITIQ